MFFAQTFNYEKGVLSRASITIQLIEDVAIYKAQIFSSNGNIFGTRDKSTDISVVVWKGLNDITAKFSDFEWKRFTVSEDKYQEDLEWGEAHRNLKNFTLTKEEINTQAKIQVEVYGQMDGERKLLAVDYVTFIDVNDMQGSPTPPDNPKDGDLWLDTSTVPPTLRVWDESLGMWVEVVIAGNDKRNLLRNSNFYKKTLDFWTKVGSWTEEFESLSGKKWLRLKSDTGTMDYVGISQIVKNARPKSKYSFQALANVYLQSQHPLGDMTVAFFSIDENKKKTLIKEQTYDLGKDAKCYTDTFESLADTKEIEVIISGAETKPFDFIVTNTMLANYPIPTEWELALEDVQDALDHKVGNTPEEVFGSLTDDGKMQGIYTDIDEHGQKNYYFNASYIKTGKLLGEYIEGRNLLIRNDNDDVTLHVDNHGDIFMAAKKLQILTNSAGEIDPDYPEDPPPTEDEYEDVAGVSDIAWKIDIISSNGIVFKNNVINTELTAIVFKGKREVTEQLSPSQFKWTRKSDNIEEDKKWNDSEKGKGVKTINITIDDVYQKATFTCELTDIKKKEE